MLTFGKDFADEKTMAQAVLREIAGAKQANKKDEVEIKYRYGIDYKGKGRGEARDALCGKGNISYVEREYFLKLFEEWEKAL